MPGFGNGTTEQFMLGSATVMLGEMADMLNLNPDNHGIGLVKNFQVEATPGYTELKQGTKNISAYSVMTSFDVKASMEVFEYTAKNMAYALGLDGTTGYSSDAGSPKQSTLATAVDGVASATTITVTTGDGSKFIAGDVIMINDTVVQDRATVRRVASVASDTITLDAPLAIGVQFGAGSTVRVTNEILIGDGATTAPKFLSAKVVGALANNDKIVLIFPKVLITKGFTVAFQNKDYGNLPFEFTMYDMLPADPNYSSFGQRLGKAYTIS